jgi:hypothetical protein
VLIDREIPALQAQIADMSKTENPSPAQKQELSAANAGLKLLEYRRKLLLERTGTTFLASPPAATKP